MDGTTGPDAADAGPGRAPEGGVAQSGAPESGASDGRPEATEALLHEVRALMRRMRSSSIVVAQAHGLQTTQAQVLFALRRLGECRVARLAEKQLVDPSVASRQVAALEKEGLVSRRPDPEDARASLVTLSEQGHAHLAELRRHHMAVFSEALQDWPTERVVRFTEDIEAFTEAIQPYYDYIAHQVSKETASTESAPEQAAKRGDA